MSNPHPSKFSEDDIDMEEDEDDEEKAAYEDYVCEEPEDSDRYPKICKPRLFED